MHKVIQERPTNFQRIRWKSGEQFLSIAFHQSPQINTIRVISFTGINKTNTSKHCLSLEIYLLTETIVMMRGINSFDVKVDSVDMMCEVYRWDD